KSCLQVAAAERQKRRAVTLLDRLAPWIVVRDFACRRLPADSRRGRERNLPQAILDAEPAMHLHGVRALLDAGAKARERVRLLVNGHLQPSSADRRRDGETTDAGANDGDGGILAGKHGGF